MREAIFILFVVLVLLAITAVRYRKQIAGMIGFAQMLKEVKQNVAQGSNNIQGDTGKSIPLVNCTKCGVWVPQNKARKVADVFFCSDECLQKSRV